LELFAEVTVGVTLTNKSLQLIVPVLFPRDKLTTGLELSFTTVTTLLLALEEHPFELFVTTKLYVPGAVNVGLAVVSVPAKIPEVGDQS
jgi:hypothetical protein